jgi:hypothetical protein
MALVNHPLRNDPARVRTDNQVGSLAEAKQQLRRAWEAVRTAARCFDRADLVPKETMRFWRVSVQRQRTQVLGSVKRATRRPLRRKPSRSSTSTKSSACGLPCVRTPRLAGCKPNQVPDMIRHTAATYK